MTLALTPMVLFAASQVGTPGPANVVLMATGARHGLRGAWPFVAGVVLGKQLIVWPIGFGLMEIAARAPGLFTALQIASVAYILWLAWRVAFMRLDAGAGRAAPGFAAGLIVHPLNPKAWAMITTLFTAFVPAGTDPLIATAAVAGVLFATQVVLHPLWTLGGAAIARSLAGHPAERALFVGLAALTVLSVFYALSAGGLP
ncbi:MAG: LysE family translocator [Shimia sp.]